MSKVMNGGLIKSQTDNNHEYVLSGEPLKSGETHVISYEVRYDDNAGANMIRLIIINGKG